jgi:hypothetical protein
MVPSRPDLLSESVLSERADLLRLCCAICSGDQDHVRPVLERRRDRIDWPALIKVAKDHRLEMQLYQAVESRFAEYASPVALDTLRRLYADNLTACRGMTTDLLRLMDQLASEKIPAIAYKGPVLGAQLYGDFALRIYKDLDILIRERDLAAVTRMMLGLGYQAGMPLSWEMSFAHPTGESVDLHWAIAEPIHQFPFSTDDLLTRSVAVSLDGTAVSTLGPEDTLLAVCFNGLTEDWQRCDRIADVAAILRDTNAIDWSRFLDMCRRNGCERLVVLALHLAKELFRARLPEVVEARLQAHRKAINKMGYATDDFLRFVITSTDRRQGFEVWRYHLHMRESRSARVPYYQSLAYNLFKPKDDDAPWQRTSRHVLYKLLRLPLLGIKHGLRAFGHTKLEEPQPHS